jgi:hypothetical protein
MKITMEKNNQEVNALKIVREEVTYVNEELRETQSQVFHALGDIQRHYDDMVVLQDKIDEQRGQYKESNVPLINWNIRKKCIPMHQKLYPDTI